MAHRTASRQLTKSAAPITITALTSSSQRRIFATPNNVVTPVT